MRLSKLILSVPVLLVSVAACERSAPDAKPPASVDGPNVLLITLDTTRADRLGCYGYESAVTPRLDALAKSGVRVAHALAQVPLTLPSHVSLLTGTHPPSNGIHVNGAGALGEEPATLGGMFQRQGYRTGAFVAAWVLNRRFGLDRGFEHYDDRTERDALGVAATSERSGDQVTDAALAWLAKESGRPFFAWVHYFDPHHPYEPPSAFRNRGEDLYDGEIAFVDSQVGRLLEWLAAKGIAEQTLVVVAGDHGEAFGEHGEIEHGFFVYDTTMRVPLILSWPGTVPAGAVVDSCVGLVDVAPTIAELVGQGVPGSFEGMSMVGLWDATGNEREPVYGESEYAWASFSWARLRCLVTERWKFIAAPKPELYDRSIDPGEAHNVADQHPEVVAEMQGELASTLERMTPRKATAVATDGDALRHLANLGYVGAARKADEAKPESARNPLDMIGVFNDFRKAKTLAESQRYGEVVELIEPHVRQCPDSGELHGILAEAYLRLGRFADAQRSFERSLQTFDADAWKWCGLGEALAGQGKADEAMGCYLRAIELEEECGPAHARLGVAYAERGDFANAAKHHQRDVEINPRSPIALTNLAGVLPPLGRVDESLRLLRRAIELDPKYVPAQRALGEGLRFVGRSTEAAKVLRSAVAALPDDPGLCCDLSWTLSTARDASARNPEESVHWAQRCVQLAPADPRSFDVLAASYAAAGDFRQAVSAAQQAMALVVNAGPAEQRAAIAQRFRMYQAGQPYRE